MNVNSRGHNLDTRLEHHFLKIKHPPGLKNPMGALLSHFLSNVDNVYKYLYTRPVSEKPIFWVASSLDDVRSFPEQGTRQSTRSGIKGGGL